MKMQGAIFYVNKLLRAVWKVCSRRFKYRFQGKSESFKNIRKLIHERAFHQSKILRKVISSQNLTPFILVDGTNDLQMNSDKIISFINNKIIRK